VRPVHGAVRGRVRVSLGFSDAPLRLLFSLMCVPSRSRRC
jgi:hypothetical protein